MTSESVVISSLLVITAVFGWMACLGVLSTRGVFNQMHYLTSAGIFSVLAITTALFVSDGFSQGVIKSFAILILIWISNPFLVQAVSRTTRRCRSRPKSAESEKRE